MDPKRQLQHLFSRIDEPVELPAAQDRFQIAEAPDIVNNVRGSVAGASSSDFHIYRQLRRKEMKRQHILDEKAKDASPFANLQILTHLSVQIGYGATCI